MLCLMVAKQWPYGAAAIAFEAMTRTLAQNCGVNIVIWSITALQGKLCHGSMYFMINSST